MSRLVCGIMNAVDSHDIIASAATVTAAASSVLRRVSSKTHRGIRRRQP